MTYVDCNKCRVNAFIEDLCDPAFCSKFAKEGNSDDFTEAIEEVIHCKDCKHYWEEKTLLHSHKAFVGERRVLFRCNKAREERIVALRKYKRGKQICTVSDFDQSSSMFYVVYFGSCNPQTKHRSFLISWQYRTLLNFIEKGWVFEAERKEE